MSIVTLLVLGTVLGEQLYQQEHTASEPWSTELLQDYVTLGYDPAHGFVRGYQQSTGRVYAQGQNKAVSHRDRLSAVPIQTDRARFIGLGNASDLSLRGDCLLLKAGSAVDDTDVFWSASNGDNREWWRVHSEGRMGTQAVTVGDAIGSTCTCTFRDATGVWQELLGTFSSNGCRAAADATRHDKRFCRELTVALSRKVFLIVTSSRAVLARSLRSCWLQGLHTESEHKLAPSETTSLHTFRPPRATVAVSMKHGAEAMDIVTANAHNLRAGTLNLAVHSIQHLDRYHPAMDELLYNLKLSSTLRATIDRVKRHSLTKHRVCPKRCTGRADQGLAEFMQTDSVSLTPEVANTTLLSMSYADYMGDMIHCNLCILKRLASFTGCSLMPYGIPVSTTPFAAHKLERKIDLVLKPTSTQPILAIDRADKKVEDVNQIMLELYEYAEELAYAHNHATRLLQSSALSQRLEVARTIWCCATQTPFELLNVSISCQPNFSAKDYKTT